LSKEEHEENIKPKRERVSFAAMQKQKKGL